MRQGSELRIALRRSAGSRSCLVLLSSRACFSGAILCSVGLCEMSNFQKSQRAKVYQAVGKPSFTIPGCRMCLSVCMGPQATTARVALGRLHDLLTAKELPPTIQPAPEASADDAVHAAGDGEHGTGHHGVLAGPLKHVSLAMAALVAVTGSNCSSHQTPWLQACTCDR